MITHSVEKGLNNSTPFTGRFDSFRMWRMKPEISNNRCPSCRKKVVETTLRTLLPFCSQRCKMVDLGKWFNEEFSIPAADTLEDDEQFSGSQENTREEDYEYDDHSDTHK